MSEETTFTVICLWCNRVQAWGKAEISYGVCLSCSPRVADEVRSLEASRLANARVASKGRFGARRRMSEAALKP